MPQTAGNIITTGYWSSSDVMPGWVLNHWVGTAIITELDIDWDVLDFRGDKLPMPAGTRIHSTKFELYDDVSAPAGYALKLGASATDTGVYVVNTAVAGGSNIISKGVFRNALSTPYTVVSNFTFGLFLHNGNAAPSAGQRAQAAQTSPTNTLYPATARPKPVRLDFEISWSRPDDGSLASMDIRPCPLHDRLLAGIQ